MVVYLNACGHGPSDPAVLRRMAAHLVRELEIGEVGAAGEIAAERAGVREAAARSIGATADRTGLCATTSDPWEALMARIPLAGKRVLIAPHEWSSNVHFLSALAANAGGRVEVLPPLDVEAPDPGAWQARIDGDVAAICVPMVTSVTGLRYPVEAIGALERPEDCLFIVDAAQALGQEPVDVGAIGCDALCATTRKWMRGPHGTGLYWVGERAGAVTGLRAAEMQTNPALLVAQGVALSMAGDRGTLPALLRDGLKDRGIVALPGSTGAVTIRVSHGKVSSLRRAMHEAGIIGKWPDPALDEPASGLTLEDGALLRLSPHVYNTEDEIAQAIAVITR